MNKQEFEKGVIYAVSTLIRIHDEPGMALDILKESGIDFEKVDAPNYDLGPIYEALGIEKDLSEEE